MKKLFILVCLILNGCQSNPFKQYETNKINVYIEGEIQHPGSYDLEIGASLLDLIHQSGGYTELADTTLYDTSRKIEDKEKIIIYKKNENKVNINNANEKQLQLVEGIGKTIAKRIVEYRNTNGMYISIEDIKKVKGINDKLYQKIASQIKVQ